MRVPALLICVRTNTKAGKLGLLVAIVTNIVLLLIMVVGLLYLYRYGGATLGLAGLLWKQVGCWWSLLDIALSMY